MGKPITTTATRLSFEQRLQRVNTEVRARIAAYPTEQQNGLRGRLWVNWLNKNVLEVA